MGECPAPAGLIVCDLSLWIEKKYNAYTDRYPLGAYYLDSEHKLAHIMTEIFLSGLHLGAG